MPNEPVIVSAATSVESLAFLIDGYPDETHVLKSRTGGEPLEDGRQVTDYVIAEPAEVALSGVVSDLDGTDLPRAVWEELRRMQREAETTRIVTEWGTYEECVIARAEATPQGRGMRFELEFKEVLRVGAPEIVPIPAPTGPAGDRRPFAGATTSLGAYAFFFNRYSHGVRVASGQESSILSDVDNLRAAGWQQDLRTRVSGTNRTGGIADETERTELQNFGVITWTTLLKTRLREQIYDDALGLGYSQADARLLAGAVIRLASSPDPQPGVLIDLERRRGQDEPYRVGLLLNRDFTVSVPPPPYRLGLNTFLDDGLEGFFGRS